MNTVEKTCRNLSGSGLAGGISRAIANLTALTSLSVFLKRISNFVQNRLIFSCFSPRNLSNNNLTGEIPDELARLQNLSVV